jgi:uncharacterized damage-inducible protein DinB
MHIDAALAQSHFAYTRWANTRVIDAVKALTLEEQHRPLYTSYRSLLGTLEHMFQAERIWLARFKAEPKPSFGKAGEFRDIEDLEAAWRTLAADVERWANSLDAAQLETHLTWHSVVKNRDFTAPLWQLILHVMNHSSYHRGQVVAMLRQLGHEGVGTDLVFFYLEQQAPK